MFYLEVTQEDDGVVTVRVNGKPLPEDHEITVVAREGAITKIVIAPFDRPAVSDQLERIISLLQRLDAKVQP